MEKKNKERERWRHTCLLQWGRAGCRLDEWPASSSPPPPLLVVQSLLIIARVVEGRFLPKMDGVRFYSMGLGLKLWVKILETESAAGPERLLISINEAGRVFSIIKRVENKSGVKMAYESRSVCAVYL